MSTGRSFYVVDSGYHFRASFYALPPMYSPDGTLVNAVYGFVSTLLKLLKTRRPEALAIAGDAEGYYFRHRLLPTYKSGKKPTPEECIRQIPLMQRVLNAMAIPYVRVADFEADDIIATLTVEARRNGYHSCICTRDKDLQQLLADDVLILDMSSGKETTGTTLKEEKGILPHQIPDMLALVGDRVDSIPGIPGVGQKTAAGLLGQYGTLENILQHAEELTGRLRTTIAEHREQALTAKKVATLQSEVPLVTPFSDFTFRPPHRDALESLFTELGLQHLLGRVEQGSPSSQSPPVA